MAGRRENRRPISKVLVDTHALVWALSEPERLGSEARRALPEAEVSASVVSLWDLLLKQGKPGALLADPMVWWERDVVKSDIRVSGIRQSHVMALGQLGDFHKGPFDRNLLTQAQVERAALVRKDSALAAYDVAIVWCRGLGKHEVRRAPAARSGDVSQSLIDGAKQAKAIATDYLQLS